MSKNDFTPVSSDHACLPQEQPGQTPWLALGCITLLAAVLRAIGLNGGAWFDEIVTLVESVRPSFIAVLTEYSLNNKHPLYSVLAHLSVAVCGEHTWSLRLPAFLFGVACVPMLYFLAVSVTTRREALLASTLLALSYHHIWFSQNARGYTALAFFAMLSTHLLIRGLCGGGWRPYIGYGVVTALGVYTHMTMVFVVVSHFLLCGWLWLTAARGELRVRDWRAPLLAFGLAGLLSLAFYAPMLAQVHQFYASHSESSGKAVATPAWAIVETLRALSMGLGTWGVLLAAGVAFAWGLWSYARQSLVVLAFFLLPGFVTAAPFLALDRPMRPRFFFFLAGFGLMILVRGLVSATSWFAARLPARGSARRLEVGIDVALVLAVALASSPSLLKGYAYPKQDYEQAMRFVEANKAAEEPVASVGLTIFPYKQYYGKQWHWIDSAAQLQDLRERSPSVWLLYTLPEYLETETPDLMGAIRKEFTVVRVFPGTVGGGDIVVCWATSEGRGF